MNNTTLYIKNMVCNRCIMVVQDLLGKLGFTVLHIELGKVLIQETPEKADLERIRQALEAVGFELIDDKRDRLIEQIKQEIIQLVHNCNGELKVNLSDYLSEKLHHDYSSLSKVFSETNGITIENISSCKNRTCKGAARIRRTVAQRNSCSVELLQCSPPKQPVQKHYRNYTQRI